MAKIIGIKGRPVAYLCSSGLELNALIDGSRRFSKGDAFVLLIDGRPELMRRVLAGYVNSYIRYRERTTRAESLQMELLLFIAGTMNIGRAIRECGAKGSRRFVAVANDSANFTRFAKSCNVKRLRECKLSLDTGIAPQVSVSGISGES